MALLVPLSVLAGVGLTRLAWGRAPKRAAARPLPPLGQTVLVQRHLAAREVLTAQVIAGEASLFEAAVGFRRLNEAAGYRDQPFWQRLPGDGPDEKACRQVIAWVKRRLEGGGTTPSQVEAAAAALEADLDEHIARHGGVILPEGL
jgi:hypothetical protein